MAWSPIEYRSLIRGSQYRVIDEYEFMAREAMAFRYAQNAKRATERKIFNAKQARRNLDIGIENNDRDIERMINLNNKFKGFKPDFKPKGG